MRKFTALLITMGMVVSMMGTGFAAVSGDIVDTTQFTVSANVGERPMSYDYAVKMFFDSDDDPVLDGTDLAKSTNLNFGTLTWDYGRWNGQYAFAVLFYMDGPNPYNLSVAATDITHADGTINPATGDVWNISDSVVVTPHWATKQGSSEPADVFIWDEAQYNPALPCDDNNFCTPQDSDTTNETMADEGFSIQDIVDAGSKEIYRGNGVAKGRIMRTYIGIYTVPEGYTGDVNDLPGSALDDAIAGDYQGTITYTMTVN